MSVHVVLNDGIANNEMLTRVNNAVTHSFKISHTTIQLEQPGYMEEETHL